MTIRIQPLDIDVPEENPFENDLLGRKDAADVLTRIVGNIEGPGAVAIDAEWGAGKTTFLNMWSRHLQNQGFPVVAFNAWETDFAGEPMVALITELASALGEEDSKSLKAAANEIAIRILPNLFKPIPILGSAMAGAVEDTIDHFREGRVSDYQRVRDDFRQFKANLSKAAETLSKCHDGHQLIVIIDELDRCRPSYAVELLEIAKHWFMVDHIVFVLAVNRSQLAHSVRVLYGTEFDAEGYLGRFFDLDFILPEPNRQRFVTSLLSTRQLDVVVSNAQGRLDGYVIGAGIGALREFLILPSISLRSANQAVNRLGMMLALFDQPAEAVAVTSVVALILRMNDREIYMRFIGGDATDEMVAEAVFRDPSMSAYRESRRGVIIEAAIVVACQPDSATRLGVEELNSPLLSRYAQAPQGTHGSLVMDQVRSMWSDRQYRFGLSGFSEAVQRLELLSADGIRR